MRRRSPSRRAPPSSTWWSNLGLVKAGEWDGGGEPTSAAVRGVGAGARAAQGDPRVGGARPTTSWRRPAGRPSTPGADYVKTSTGFHPAGGATVEAVRADGATRRSVALGVKASGGIRDAATALAMVDAGATRLGCSATRAILDGALERQIPAASELGEARA